MPIARQLSKALFIVTASAALAVASGITSLSGTQVWGAERPILVNEIEDASRIVCRNRYGMTVFTANDAYNVRIDPSGTIYSFRKGWFVRPDLHVCEGDRRLLRHHAEPMVIQRRVQSA